MHSHTSSNGQGKDIFKVTMYRKFYKSIAIKCYDPDLQRSLLNEQRHFSHCLYNFNCLQNSGFQIERICANNVYFFDSSYQKNFKFQLWFLVQNSINLHMSKDASQALNIPLMGGAIFQELGSHGAQKHSLNDLKLSEVQFSKLLLGEILLKVDKNATNVNQCGKFAPPNQKTTSIRIFSFNHYLLVKRPSYGVLIVFDGNLSGFPKLPFFLSILSSHST